MMISSGISDMRTDVFQEMADLVAKMNDLLPKDDKPKVGDAVYGWDKDYVGYVYGRLKSKKQCEYDSNMIEVSMDWYLHVDEISKTKPTFLP